MEEINFKELGSYIMQKIWLVFIILAVVFAGGEIYTSLLKTPLYRSETSLVLINENKTITANDITLSNNLVKTYSEIVKSRNVLEKVAKNLNSNSDASAIASKISVSSTASTQLIHVAVSDKNPKTAEQIANEVAKVFKSEIKTIYKIDNVQIVDRAIEATSPYNINILKDSLLYFTAGLILGLGATILLYSFDKTIKNFETIEERLGLTVIGVVPKLEEKK